MWALHVCRYPLSNFTFRCAWPLEHPSSSLMYVKVRKKRNQKKTLPSRHDFSDSKTTMKTSACAGRSRVFWSYTTMATRIYSCCRSQMPSSSCRSSFFLLRVGFDVICRRPGDYLKPGEDEIEGLKKRLDDRLAPPAESKQFNSSHGVDNEWEIGDCLAQWWRPNFETFMVRASSCCSALWGLDAVFSWLPCTYPCVVQYAVSVHPRAHH